jgi:hypothetical protein
MYLDSIYKYFQEFRVPVESSSLKIEIARNCSEFETPPNATARALSYQLRGLRAITQPPWVPWSGFRKGEGRDRGMEWGLRSRRGWLSGEQAFRVFLTPLVHAPPPPPLIYH